jgi:hypothetical protein
MCSGREGEEGRETYVIGMINIAAFLGGTPVRFLGWNHGVSSRF